MTDRDSNSAGVHLRLVWPQWQGAGTESVRSLAPEFPFQLARRGYAVGTRVLQAVLPEHDGPTATVPVEMGDRGLEVRDGIEAKAVVLEQLGAALSIIGAHGPDRITTLGGDCSVSMAPFSYLIDSYGDDLAILWIDSHPDMGTGHSAYPGYHAMVVSALTGHGDQDLLDLLPATTSAANVALIGMHDWTDPTLPSIAQEWGLTVFAPEVLRRESSAVLDWLAGTGATKVAVHFDVDTIDADEVQLGLGFDRGGLTRAEARRIVADIDHAADVVALTIAEYIPRQVMQLQQLVSGFPLLGPAPAHRAQPGPFFHGTKADLLPGDLLEAGYSSNFGERTRANFTYLTATLDAATGGAELAVGDGPGRIYQVEPTGPIEDDPNLTDQRFPGNPTKSYRTRRPLRVISEVADWERHPPEVVQAMLDRLAELKRLGVEAIND